MKIVVFLLSMLMSSCSFYFESCNVILKGAGVGRIEISSINYFKEMKVSTDVVVLEVEKGMKYSILFFPDFYSFESRYPLGAYILPGDSSAILKPELGPIVMASSMLNRAGYTLNEGKLMKLLEVIDDGKDSWIFYQEDIVLFLKGVLSLSSIGRKRVISIPELADYSDWIPENRLFKHWYPSIQSFRNPVNNQFLRVEIFDNGNYNYFIYVN